MDPLWLILIVLVAMTAGAFCMALLIGGRKGENDDK